jgi:hypothetical protein
VLRRSRHYYTIIVVILMNGRVALAHYAEFGSYSGIAYQLAIAAGALIIYASARRSMRHLPRASNAWAS